MKPRTLTYATAGTAAMVALGAAVLYATRSEEPEGFLGGSGQVRGTEVTISARVGGVAKAVAVREGQMVKRGDLLAEIDAREIEARLAQARADVEALRAKRAEIEAQLRALGTSVEQARAGAQVARDSTEHEIHGAREGLARAEAEVRAAEAEAVEAAKLEARYAELRRQDFVSETYYEGVRTRARAAEARLRAAQRAREQARAALELARAAAGEVRVKEEDPKRLAAERQRVAASLETLARTEESARGRVAEVEATLADTRLVAPIDGTVMSRLAEPGELVPPGRPIATLVDLGALYARVYIPEREIAKVRLGNPARLYADAFPERPFAGKVVEIAERAEFTPKDAHVKDEREKLVFGVKVAIDNPAGELKPGMPVDVQIKWKDAAAWPRSR
ncbi:MAG TPA: HlyD family efflux transporter periplasmic adaptor subunit [Burkholderiales bacterium]|nr:HlyD family efflux transporter periplasmic adaptor subunit [Burkholderiales bacterium]